MINAKKILDFIASNFEMIYPERPDTKVVLGKEAVLEEAKAFQNDLVVFDFDNMVSNSLTDPAEDFKKNNSEFYSFISGDTKEIIGIRNYNQFDFSKMDLMVSLNFIPFKVDVERSSEENEKAAYNVLKIYENEMERIRVSSAIDRLPLILVERIEDNIYCGYSYFGNKKIYVYDYKSYKDGFEISEEFTYDKHKRCKNDKYSIFTPTDEFIEALNLKTLNSEIWDLPQFNERLDNVPDKIALSNVKEEYLDYYYGAVEMINQYRSGLTKLNDWYYQLESQVYRFEKLVKRNANAWFINNVILDIRDSLEALNE